jgi:hypothetical protein
MVVVAAAVVAMVYHKVVLLYAKEVFSQRGSMKFCEDGTKDLIRNPYALPKRSRWIGPKPP